MVVEAADSNMLSALDCACCLTFYQTKSTAHDVVSMTRMMKMEIEWVWLVNEDLTTWHGIWKMGEEPIGPSFNGGGGGLCHHHCCHCCHLPASLENNDDNKWCSVACGDGFITLPLSTAS